jgi:hypothetical protein
VLREVVLRREAPKVFTCRCPNTREQFRFLASYKFRQRLG